MPTFCLFQMEKRKQFFKRQRDVSRKKVEKKNKRKLKNYTDL